MVGKPSAKAVRFITLAFFNAYGQFLFSYVTASFAVMGAVNSPPTPALVPTLETYVPLSFGVIFFAPAGFSLSLIPAWANRRWQIIAVAAMLLSAVLMLLIALTSVRAFFIHVIGYLLSAFLVQRAYATDKHDGSSAR